MSNYCTDQEIRHLQHIVQTTEEVTGKKSSTIVASPKNKNASSNAEHNRRLDTITGRTVWDVLSEFVRNHGLIKSFSIFLIVRV